MSKDDPAGVIEFDPELSSQFPTGEVILSCLGFLVAGAIVFSVRRRLLTKSHLKIIGFVFLFISVISYWLLDRWFGERILTRKDAPSGSYEIVVRSVPLQPGPLGLGNPLSQRYYLGELYQKPYNRLISSQSCLIDDSATLESVEIEWTEDGNRAFVRLNNSVWFCLEGQHWAK